MGWIKLRWHHKFVVLFALLGTTRPLCVLDNKKGWWLDCGLRDSYLLRIKDFGGITARFDFALGLGDEKGFPHSIRNTNLEAEEEDPYAEVRPPSPHPNLKYPYEEHRLYSRSSDGAPPPRPSTYGDTSSAPRSSERRWSAEHPSVIPDTNRKGVWVRLPMQQVLKNGKPVGVRYLNGPGKGPRPGGRYPKPPVVPSVAPPMVPQIGPPMVPQMGPPMIPHMFPPMVHNATAAVPLPNIVTIGGKKYQMFVPPAAKPVPIMPMTHWPQHPQQPQQYRPQHPQQIQHPQQHRTKERISHSGSETFVDLQPPPVPSPAKLPPPIVMPLRFQNQQPHSLRVPARPLELTRQEFKSPPESVFQPVKFRPHVESFRSPPPLPEYANEVEPEVSHIYDGPVIGEMLGEILQLSPDTPADSDHVPSFAAQQLVVRDAPSSMHPPGYNASLHSPPSPTTRLPRTKFFCEEREFLPGLYADVQLGCKIFHLCVPAALGSSIQSFLCPNSTLFDQSILQCNYWQLVDCSVSHHHYSANQPLALSYRRVNAAHLPPQEAANPLVLSMLSDFRAEEE